MEAKAEEPGILACKALRALSAVLEETEQGRWYASFRTPRGEPVVVSLAIGADAVRLAAFVEARRMASPQAEEPMLYDGQGNVVDGGRPA